MKSEIITERKKGKLVQTLFDGKERLEFVILAKERYEQKWREANQNNKGILSILQLTLCCRGKNLFVSNRYFCKPFSYSFNS